MHLRYGFEHVLEIAVILVDDDASDVKRERPYAEHAELSETKREALDVSETFNALRWLGECLVVSIIELLATPERQDRADVLNGLICIFGRFFVLFVL